jgi:hypothetical protein
LKDVKENTQLSVAERKEKNKDILMNRQAELRKILTADQLAKYQQLMKQYRDNRKEDKLNDEESEK